ncbi:hypothetical protein D9619_003967 [Psilocybe cf. subviscida]|uniref:Uncharacterized protein n=1 Tax=Psilocybe cf. subviscida TaxID=2480587 RepID=A0A8H5BNK5_9AGAR|nr:hypothetical protein D9619_003967 [Psilocybe cf. subviscida]
MTSARRLKDAHNAKSAWVFLIFSILMYVVATLHLILAAFRFYKGFFLNVDPNGAMSYLKNWNHWEYFWLIVLFCVQTWLGDALVIYRCYFVWGGNLWLVLVPVFLLLASIGINVVMWYWVHHPSSIAPKQAIRVLTCVYPLAFAQNLMTTSLIIFKIFMQHRESKKAGVVDLGSTLSLIRVARIVVESAAIYTIQLLIIIILYFRGNNGQYVIQAAVNPSIGITFVLLAIRIQPPRSANAASGINLGVASILIPQWIHNTQSDSDINSEIFHDDGPRPAEGGIGMVHVQKIDTLQEGSGMESSSNSAKQSTRAVALTV